MRIGRRGDATIPRTRDSNGYLSGGDDDGERSEARAVTVKGAHPDTDAQNVQGTHPCIGLAAVEQFPVAQRIRADQDVQHPVNFVRFHHSGAGDLENLRF